MEACQYLLGGQEKAFGYSHLIYQTREKKAGAMQEELGQHHAIPNNESVNPSGLASKQLGGLGEHRNCQIPNMGGALGSSWPTLTISSLNAEATVAASPILDKAQRCPHSCQPSPWLPWQSQVTLQVSLLVTVRRKLDS